MRNLVKIIFIVHISISLIAIMCSCKKVTIPDLTSEVPINISWSKCFGGSERDYFSSLIPTTDGKYLAAGIVKSTDGDITGSYGNWDGWLVKITQEGTIEWQKCFGGSNDDSFSDVINTSDGGYVITGTTSLGSCDVCNRDAWIIKLNPEGNIEWQKYFGGNWHDSGASIMQTSDGGYILAGNTLSTDIPGYHIDALPPISNVGDGWLLKINSEGNIEWQKCYGGSQGEGLKSILQTSDGGYIVAGDANSKDGDVTGLHGNPGTRDEWILKLDHEGSIEWQRCYGGSEMEILNTMIQTSDGGYMITGITLSNDGDISENHGTNDGWILKLTSAGIIEWQKCYGGSEADGIFSVSQTSDGSYIAVGYTGSIDGDVSFIHGERDGWMLKINQLGIIKGQKCFGGSDGEGLTKIIQIGEKEYIVGGTTASNDGDVSGNHGQEELWIMKLITTDN
jgi:hypothetical protein